MGERIGLTDEEWTVISPLLPAESGRGCRPAQDNRRYFEGMLWMARTGEQWRHLSDEYGKWNASSADIVDASRQAASVLLPVSRP
ncbi:transposase [Brucella intermedia]|nr:transposase [Brucella intermedia]